MTEDREPKQSQSGQLQPTSASQAGVSPSGATLDETQSELFREQGETDSRSQVLADEYEEPGSGEPESMGQQVSGGQYGSKKSDANQSGVDRMRGAR